MVEYTDFNQNILKYFDSINKDWSKEYHYMRKCFPDNPTKMPEIYQDFKLYVNNLMNEKYEECKAIKRKIFISY